VAVATDIYTAAQSFDPNGDLYDPSGYTAAQGTSFAVPMVAGAVALVKQRNPGFGVAQLKSAVVNTAANEINDELVRSSYVWAIAREPSEIELAYSDEHDAVSPTAVSPELSERLGSFASRSVFSIAAMFRSRTPMPAKRTTMNLTGWIWQRINN